MRDGGFRSHLTDVLDPIGTAGSSLMLQLGEMPGQCREELYAPTGLNGVTSEFKLVTASATILPNQLLYPDTTSDLTGCTVKPTTGATNIPCGIAPNSLTQGQAALTQINAGQSFWMQTGGVGQANIVTGSTAGSEQSATATAGAGGNAPFTAATQQGVFGTLLQANSSGITAVRPVLLQGLN